jgi:hypothetical protein
MSRTKLSISWFASYYNNITVSGSPVEEAYVAEINNDWSDKAPTAGVNKDNFSVRWTGSFSGAGEFEFNATSDDGMRVWVDGQKVIDMWYSHGALPQIATRTLGGGSHQVVVEYFDSGGNAVAKFNVYQLSIGPAQTEAERQRGWERVNATGPLTRGGLVAARIYEADDDGYPMGTSDFDIIYCMFNPADYAINKSNSYKPKGLDKNGNYNMAFDRQKANPRTLSISALWFDTYETGEDVSQVINKLTAYAEKRGDRGAQTPSPKVAFQWGDFRFLGLITSINVEYTLFKPDGTPVRAKVSNFKLKEFKHRKAYPQQNPSSGNGPEEHIWRVSAGDRLDTIAAKMYGNATQWRIIADRNKIINPFLLTPGEMLRIPPIDH